MLDLDSDLQCLAILDINYRPIVLRSRALHERSASLRVTRSLRLPGAIGDSNK